MFLWKDNVHIYKNFAHITTVTDADQSDLSIKQHCGQS